MITSNILKENEKFCFDIEKCLRVEELIKNTNVPFIDINKFFEMNNKISKASMKNLDLWVGFCITNNFSKLDVEDPNEQMTCHYLHRYLSKWTLTRDEFDILFDHSPQTDEYYREKMWRHNQFCAVNFVNTYSDVIKCIDFLRDIKNPIAHYNGILHILKHTFKRLQTIELFRTNFPYCEKCVHSEKECKFWRDFQTDIYQLIRKIGYKALPNEISNYLKELKIPCKIPTNL